MTRATERLGNSRRSAGGTRNPSFENGKALERIVGLLESALSDRDVEIKVRHSLIDRSTGASREVDIYIEETLRGQVHVSIIECRCHKEKVNLTYIEQIVTKRADTGNPHTYVVSRSGFTQGAIRKAAHHNVGLFTLAETTDPLWPEWMAKGAFHEVRLEASVRGLRFIGMSAREQTFTLTDELRTSNPGTPIFLDNGGRPKASRMSAVRDAIARLSAEDMQSIRQWVQQNGPLKLNLRVAFPEPRFVKFAEGLIQVSGFQAGLELSLARLPLSLPFCAYRDISTGKTRGESFSGTLSDGTLVALVRDPAANQLFVTAIPPQGRTNSNVEVTLVGQDEHGNEVTGTASLVIDDNTQPPKIVIPLRPK